MPETSKYSYTDLVKAACMAYSVDENAFHTFMAIQAQLEPWEQKFLSQLLQERAAYFREKESVSAMLACKQWGSVAHEKSVVIAPKLPPGYSMTVEADDCILRYNGSREEYLGTFTTIKACMAAAVSHDKAIAPYKWRRVEDGCPENVMLMFSSVEFPAAKPPVKQGYRHGDEFHLFGGSWNPTHWCYSPEGPVQNAI